MIFSSFDISGLIPETPAIVESMLGTVAMLLSFIWEPLKRKDRLGNVQSRICLAFILLVGMASVVFCLSEWWLSLCLLPVVYLIFRWQILKYKRNKALSAKGEDRDEVLLEYINDLTESNLYEWEIKRFVLPDLIIYSDLGAVKTLKEKLDEYEVYADDAHYVVLQGFVSSVRHDNRDMFDLMKNAIKSKKFQNGKAYPVFLNNLYHAAMIREDEIAINHTFSQIENYVASTEDPYKILMEMLEAMMYRYDMLGDLNGMSRVRAIMEKRKPRNFSEYLCLGDIELSYDRRHENHEEIRRYLDETLKKLEEFENDDIDRLRFKLRIVAMYVEFNYGWKEMTVQLFGQANELLTHSPEIAVEYLKMVVKTIGDVDRLYGQVLQEEQEITLMSKVFSLSSPHVESYKSKIFNLDNRLLYKKRDGLRLLVEYSHAGTFIGESVDKYAQQLISSYNEIIALCRDNEEYSELIRSIVVYIDEYLTLKEIIHDDLFFLDYRQYKREAYQRLSGEETRIKDLLDELLGWLKKFQYDRACAYETLWAAYFCYKYKEIPKAKLLLQKFDEHQLSVRNYTKPIQSMYRQLTDSLKAA